MSIRVCHASTREEKTWRRRRNHIIFVCVRLISNEIQLLSWDLPNLIMERLFSCIRKLHDQRDRHRLERKNISQQSPLDHWTTDEMLCQIRHLKIFLVKSFDLYFDFCLFEIFAVFADRSNWSLIRMKFGITSKNCHFQSYQQIYIESRQAKVLRNQILRNLQWLYMTACVICPPPSYPVRSTSRFN